MCEIHFDGDDSIRVWGEIRDYDDVLNAADKLPFSRSYQYPAKPFPAGPHSVDATDSWGSKVRIFYTVTKGQDLDD